MPSEHKIVYIDFNLTVIIFISQTAVETWSWTWVCPPELENDKNFPLPGENTTCVHLLSFANCFKTCVAHVSSELSKAYFIRAVNEIQAFPFFNESCYSWFTVIDSQLVKGDNCILSVNFTFVFKSHRAHVVVTISDFIKNLTEWWLCDCWGLLGRFLSLRSLQCLHCVATGWRCNQS